MRTVFLKGTGVPSKLHRCHSVSPLRKNWVTKGAERSSWLGTRTKNGGAQTSVGLFLFPLPPCEYTLVTTCPKTWLHARVDWLQTATGSSVKCSAFTRDGAAVAVGAWRPRRLEIAVIRFLVVLLYKNFGDTIGRHLDPVVGFDATIFPE
jgi:hypothetical protein